MVACEDLQVSPFEATSWTAMKLLKVGESGHSGNETWEKDREESHRCSLALVGAPTDAIAI